jgi:hypothetical protein
MRASTKTHGVVENSLSTSRITIFSVTFRGRVRRVCRRKFYPQVDIADKRDNPSTALSHRRGVIPKILAFYPAKSHIDRLFFKNFHCVAPLNKAFDEDVDEHTSFSSRVSRSHITDFRSSPAEFIP